MRSDFAELVAKFTPEESITFSAAAAVPPTVELGNYQGLSVTAEEVPYEPQKVEDWLQEQREKMAKYLHPYQLNLLSINIMFRYLNKKTALIAATLGSLTLLSELILVNIAVDIQPVYAQSAPPSPTKPGNWYKQAEAELPKDAYLIYRIVDRLTRANNLDIPYWRVTIGSDYSTYAYAEGTPYLIVLSKGILDITEGDSSALAHIIAHEMAHHIHQDSAKIEKIKEEINKKMQETLAKAENNEVVMRQIMQQALDMQQPLEKLIHTLELEAHETGYSYAVRAGFDTEGGLRAMRLVVQSSETTNTEEVDPELSEIIKLLEALPTKYPPETLQQEGNNWLSLTKPLTYEFSKEEQSLRVNTKPTTSSIEDFHRQFGQ